jgi:hypothetical protein
VCLPFLFCHVGFRFSEAGFHELENLITSNVRHHVVSLAYVVPELLKTGEELSVSYIDLTWPSPNVCTDILDFDWFKSDIFTPDTYVEEAKDLYDAGYPANECPSYMVIYDALRSVCEEQRSIVDCDVDLTMLSSALAALPQLTELSLCFYETIGRKQEWLKSYLALDMTMAEKSYEHHIRTVTNAVQSARNSGIFLYAMHLSGF